MKVKKCCSEIASYSYDVEVEGSKFSIDIIDSCSVLVHIMSPVTHCPFCGRRFELEDSP